MLELENHNLNEMEDEDQEKESNESTSPENEIQQSKENYLRELLNERLTVENNFPRASRLLEYEMSKLMGKGFSKFVNVYREKPIKVVVKVLVPIKEHPKFNFVGKLLGPKGNTLKRLQEETLCKMSILGKGSSKNPQREEELKATLEPRYAHFFDELHVEISASAPPAEAHARIAYALAEIRKFLIPDSNDSIRQEQLRELGIVAPGRSSKTNRRGRGDDQQKAVSILDRARLAMEDSYGSYESYSLYEPPHSPPYEEEYYRRTSSYLEPSRWKSYKSASPPLSQSRYYRSFPYSRQSK